MSDTVVQLMGSIVQHGKHNNRVYLMKLSSERLQEVISTVDTLVDQNNYTKVCAKIPAWAQPEFAKHGYELEAAVPGFYKGAQDGLFLGKYTSKLRQTERHPDVVRDVLCVAQDRASSGCESRLEEAFTYSIAGESDCAAICRVYREVFESYPFPIHDPDYILRTMKDNVVYFCIRRDREIVSVASSEMDTSAQNVEMTDFATLPEYRGHGFAAFLLNKMEEEMKSRRLRTSYTIARAMSHGMNVTFAKLGYQFAGTLRNNTNICGRLESMNVWYKPLNMDIN